MGNLQTRRKQLCYNAIIERKLEGINMENKIVKNTMIFLGVTMSYWLLSLISLDTFGVGSEYGINFGGWVPMASGLIFGPLAAAASALGGVLLSVRDGEISVCLVNGTTAFVMAYMPYKLWHTIFCSRDKKIAFIESASTLLKYLFIAMVTAISVATVNIFENFISGVTIINYNSVRDEFLHVALQFYSTSLYIGILVIQVLTGYCSIKPKIPRNRYNRIYKRGSYAIDYALAVLVTVVSSTLFFTAVNIEQDEVSIINLLFFLLVVIVGGVLILPISRGGESAAMDVKTSLVFGVQKQVLTGASALLLCLVVLHMRDLGDIIARAGTFDKEELIRALFIMARTSTVVVVIIAGAIYCVEKYITMPVKKVSRFAENYVKNSQISEGRLEVAHVNNEVDELVSSINDMTESIERYTKELEVKAKEEARFLAEMEAAAGIQQSLLPNIYPDEKMDVCAKIIPARKVGGDFYDFAPLDNDKYFFAVADVSGKGVSAALFMMRAISLMRANFATTLSVMMERLNNELAVNNDTMMFVTGFIGVVDLKKKKFTYVNAGHNPPILFNNGNVTFIDSKPDFVLGPMKDIAYHEIEIDISKDFGVVLYSDGVTEAMNSKKELFGEDRLLLCMEESNQEKAIKATDIANRLLQKIEEFSEGEEQADDITILSFVPKFKC